jgi:hypothetical protein
MKGKFGVAALLLSSITFAVPVSTPNQLSDTPIIAGGGSAGNLSMNNCRAYQTEGTSINLSGGETLVFYGGGLAKNGGYLATKTTYSGTAYVKLSKECKLDVYAYSNYWYQSCPFYNGYAIGLFARNTDAQQDFIAGAGGGSSTRPAWVDYSWTEEVNYFYSYSAGICSPASGGGWQGESTLCNTSSGGSSSYTIGAGGSVYGRSLFGRDLWFHSYYINYDHGIGLYRYYRNYVASPGYFGSPPRICSSASGGGWQGEPSLCTEIRTNSLTGSYSITYTRGGGSVYSGYWFHLSNSSSAAGFFGSNSGGGASSISAWYDYYTKDYTSPTTSATITGGGITGQGRLYVCQ